MRPVNRRKTQKIRKLRQVNVNREQNCSRQRLFTNCTPGNLTMFTILPDRGITKIAETVLVSAICGILPFVKWPRRDLYLKELTRLSISTLEFLKIMDVPFLHTRTFQCSSYIYNAKLAIIFWLSAISSVKISKQTHFNLHFCIKNEKTQTF